MAAEAISPEDRRKTVRKTLVTDLTTGGLTQAPHVVARNPVTKSKKPKAIVILGRTPGGDGRQGWNGAIVDRFSLDIFVDENASVDPPTTADQIAAQINEALTLDKMATAMAALASPVTGIEASARRAVEWQDVDEPDAKGSWHKSADFDVEFVKVPT